MKTSNVLLGFAVSLGIGLFVAIFFLLPDPAAFAVPVFVQRHLPQAANRDIPLPVSAEDAGVTITFVGDIMLSRSVERTIVENGTDWPFAKIGGLFVGSDMVVGNLEGTVRDEQYLEVVNQMTFDTTPDNITMLKEAGFTHLSLANNHADDYGDAITQYTREVVTANDIVPFGDPYSSENFIARENVGGISISVIGFHAFGQTPSELLEAISAEDAQGRFVIVYPHWGPEYVAIAPASETTPAQLFIDAGADLIVGAHPHVIQNVEIIDGVPVIYSLGNFLFDQDFSAETKQGLTVQVFITDANIDLDFTPVRIVNRQMYLMEDVGAQDLFTTLGIPNGELSVPRE